MQRVLNRHSDLLYTPPAKPALSKVSDFNERPRHLPSCPSQTPGRHLRAPAALHSPLPHVLCRAFPKCQALARCQRDKWVTDTAPGLQELTVRKGGCHRPLEQGCEDCGQFRAGLVPEGESELAGSGGRRALRVPHQPG